MPQSVFTCANTCAIDALSPALPHANYGDVGVYLIGGSKGILRRALATFDLFGAASSGRALNAADVILSAEFLGYVTGVNGPTFQVDVERLTRADYAALDATWNDYRAGAAWTLAGGDVAAPPALVSFTSPALTGDQVLQANLAAFAVDAIANRGGLVLLRWKAHNENPGITALYTVAANPTYDPPLRLRVTYQSTVPTPIDDPTPVAAHHPGAGPSRADRSASPTPPAPASRPQQADAGPSSIDTHAITTP